MTLVEVVEKVPTDLHGKTADGLIDLILNSQNAVKLSVGLARSILHNWQSDQLASKSGLSVLFEASLQLEPQKTLETCAGLGLDQVVEALRTRVQV